MNFLAHIFLSNDDELLTVGNFIGDFVKGAQVNDYDDPVKTGILLHREIDHFTDTHEVVKLSKERLRPGYRHYSPVIVDVFYDHILAKNWDRYSSKKLEQFTMDFYLMMDRHRGLLPEQARHMFTYMKRDNWLYNYRLTEGIHRALSGMSYRTSFESRMEHAVKDLEKNYLQFETEFLTFFPDLQKRCKEFLEERK